jgi:hypothetical protein
VVMKVVVLNPLSIPRSFTPDSPLSTPYS